MSCISRAIRARSAAAASWPCWSRSRSSCSARSSSAARYARRVRTLSPSTTAAVAMPVSSTSAGSYACSAQRTTASTMPSSSIAHAAITRAARLLRRDV